MKQPTTIFFFADGNTVACDSEGQQIPELQRSWFSLYLEFLESKGVDVLKPEYYMPVRFIAKPFKIDDGYNWSIEEP